MKKFLLAFALAALLMPAFTSSSLADPERDHERGRGHGEWHRDRHWRGDIRKFRDRDLGYWHTGHWIHGPHAGHGGWWWVLGSSWYPYATPVYPYPNPYVPGYAMPIAANYAYFCRRPYGYYPYVPVCYGRWHAVPAY